MLQFAFSLLGADIIMHNYDLLCGQTTLEVFPGSPYPLITLKITYLPGFPVAGVYHNLIILISSDKL